MTAIPTSLICSLTNSLIADPVKLPCGHLAERSALPSYLFCPLDNTRITEIKDAPRALEQIQALLQDNGLSYVHFKANQQERNAVKTHIFRLVIDYHKDMCFSSMWVDCRFPNSSAQDKDLLLLHGYRNRNRLLLRGIIRVIGLGVLKGVITTINKNRDTSDILDVTIRKTLVIAFNLFETFSYLEFAAGNELVNRSNLMTRSNSTFDSYIGLFTLTLVNLTTTAGSIYSLNNALSVVIVVVGVSMMFFAMIV